MKGYLQVYGHTALDVILKTDEMPEVNTSTEVKERSVRWGGTGANIAKAAADLGIKTGLSSFIGEDFPREYRDSLYNSEIDLDGLVSIPGYDTPTCWIVTEPGGDQMALMDQGAMKDTEEQEVREEVIQNYEVIHVGTGSPRYYKRVIKKAKDLGKTITFDPAQELKYVYTPEMFEKLLDMSDIFFCNQNERDIAMKYLDLNNTDELLKFVDMVIVTKGGRGSRLYTQDDTHDIPTFEPGDIIDPTGAGDCYRAGFYAGMNRGLDPYDCCLIGSGRASFALESHGAQEKKVSWDDVVDRLELAGYSIIN